MMAGAKQPTLADVAKHAGVSTATVSRVIRNTDPVSQELRDRIEISIAKLEYTPRQSAVERSSRDTIALLIGDLLNPFFWEIAQGVQDEVNNQQMYLTLYSLADHPQRQTQLLEQLKKSQVDGVILTGLAPFPELLDWQERHNIPVILFNRHVLQPSVHCIVVDFENGMYRATQHLLALGHSRIGHLASPSTGEIAEARLQGIQAALAEAGLELQPELCPIVPPGREVGGGFQAMRMLLELPEKERPTAVIAFNDIIAVGALHAVHNHGLRVPEDISVIGVDDIALAGHAHPPLTTINQPKYHMGKLAVQTLRRMSEGRMSINNNYTLLETPLIVRESTGPCPA
jgi:DNA-binding LacI/PurR family transcriptional regulator